MEASGLHNRELAMRDLRNNNNNKEVSRGRGHAVVVQICFFHKFYGAEKVGEDN